MRWRPLRGEDGQYRPDRSNTGRSLIADVLRAAAAGYAADGDPERAATLRKRSRWPDGREGPGEPYRKHRRGAP